MLNEFIEKTRERYYDLDQTLRGYYHQDSESFEKAFERLMDNSKEALNSSVKAIQDFMDDASLSVEEKKAFIEEEVSLVFKRDQLEWLQELKSKIEKEIKNRK